LKGPSSEMALISSVIVDSSKRRMFLKILENNTGKKNTVNKLFS